MLEALAFDRVCEMYPKVTRVENESFEVSFIYQQVSLVSSEKV